MKRRSLLWFTLALLLVSCSARAEDSSDRRFEIGTQLTVLKMRNSIGETPGGIGGRVGYNLNQYVTLESEVNYFPQNPSGNFGETEALFGAKAGLRSSGFGIFAKARPGFVHFGGDFYRVRNPGNLTHPAFDLGGVAEFYPKEHLGVRIDFGDTIVAFGEKPIQTGLQPFTGGVSHNFQLSLGVLFRF